MKLGRVLPVVTPAGEVLRLVHEDTARVLLKRREVVPQWGQRGIVALLALERDSIQGELKHWPGSDIQCLMTLGEMRHLSPFTLDAPMRPSAYRTASITELQAIRMQSRGPKSGKQSSRPRAAA